MANYSLEIGSAIGTGWTYAKKYGLLVAVIYLLVGIISGGVQGLMGPSLNMEAYEGIGEAMARQDMEALAKYAQMYNSGFAATLSTWVSLIVSLVASVGLYNLALGLLSGRFNSVEFEAFKLPLTVYLKVFVVEVIVSIIIVFAAMLCIIPVFFVAPRLIFAPLYQIENPEAGIGESIKASWRISSGNTLALIGLGIALAFIGFLGFLCCCVGVYFADVIELFALVAAYYQLRGNLQTV